MHRFYLKLKALYRLLIFSQKGSIALEIAFILPLFLSLILAIFELSIIFSLRSGIEDIAREASRTKLTVSGAQVYANNAGLSGSDDEVIMEMLHEKLVNIVFTPENTTICSTIYADEESLNNDISSSARSCVIFDADPNMIPSSIPLGNSNDYARLEIVYQHDYLTPFGALLSSTFGKNLTFSTVSYFRKEEE